MVHKIYLETDRKTDAIGSISQKAQPSLSGPLGLTRPRSPSREVNGADVIGQGPGWVGRHRWDGGMGLGASGG